MLGIFVGMAFGAGALLVLPTRRRESTGPGDLADLTKVVVASGAAGLGAAALSWATTGVPAVTVLASVAGAAAPLWLRRSRAAEKRRATIAAWPDAIDVIRAAVRAGATLPEAVAEPARRGPGHLRPVFREYQRRLGAGGSFDSALDALQQGDSSTFGTRIVSVLETAAEVGSADTGRVLDSMAKFVRADLAQQREISARQSWNVAAARMAVAAPWITVIALCAQQDVRRAYASIEGTTLLVVVAALTVVAYWLMRRLGRIPDGVDDPPGRAA